MDAQHEELCPAFVEEYEAEVLRQEWLQSKAAAHPGGPRDQNKDRASTTLPLPARYQPPVREQSAS